LPRRWRWDRFKDFGNAGTAVEAIPAEITNLQDGKFAQSISGVGIGSHPNQAAAIKLARTNASKELASSIEQEVSALVKSFEQIDNESTDKTHQEIVDILVRCVSLKDSKNAKELVSRGNDGFSAYVLRVMPASAIKEMIDAVPDARDIDEAQANVSKYSAQSEISASPAVITRQERTRMLGSQAYKELEDRIAKEKAGKTF